MNSTIFFFSSVAVLAGIFEGSVVKERNFVTHELCMHTHILSLGSCLGPHRACWRAPAVGEGPSLEGQPVTMHFEIRLERDHHQVVFILLRFKFKLSFPFQNWLDPAKEIKKQIRSKFFWIILHGDVKIFREQGCLNWWPLPTRLVWLQYFLKDRLRSRILSLTGWSSLNTHF